MPRPFLFVDEAAARMNLGDDDYTLFDLPRRYAVDRGALDARWRALQAEVHPDRHAAEGASAQRLAQQWSVRVNEAYKRLRDPIARAAYLCELRGAPIDAERNTAMPAAFLVQQMAWREALDDAHDAPAVDAIEADVQATEASLLADVQRLLDDDSDAAGAAERVRALMFVARFRDDLDRRRDARGQ